MTPAASAWSPATRPRAATSLPQSSRTRVPTRPTWRAPRAGCRYGPQCEQSVRSCAAPARPVSAMLTGWPGKCKRCGAGGHSAQRRSETSARCTAASRATASACTCRTKLRYGWRAGEVGRDGPGGASSGVPAPLPPSGPVPRRHRTKPSGCTASLAKSCGVAKRPQ